MSNRNILYVALIVLVLMIFRQKGGCDDNPNVIPDPIKPVPKVVVPKVVVPKLETNLVYDDFNKAIALGKAHNRNIVIVFGAEWCPYCVVLKKDASKITQFDNFIVAFLDTDNKEANQQAVNLYRPRSLPTSVIIDVNKKELSRKIGYRNKDYTKWLDTLQQ